MFNPFKAVGDFFGGFFKNNNDDEERKRREREAAQRAAQQRKQDKPQNNPGAVVVKPSATADQQPRNNGVTKNTLLAGMTLNSDNPLQITKKPEQQQPQPQVNKPKVANLNPTVTRKEVVDAQTRFKQQYQNPNIQDVGNYYGSDRKALEEELKKGDKADIKHVQGLMRSLDNRKQEITEYRKRKPTGTDLLFARPGVPGQTMGMPQQQEIASFNKFKQDRTIAAAKKKEEEEKKKTDTEIRDFLKKNGNMKLVSGRSINGFIEEYNYADAGRQREMKKELERQASRTLDMGDKDTINEREESIILLTALDKNGKTKASATNAVKDFFGGIVGGTVDTAKNVGDSARVLATNKTSLDDVWDDYNKGKIDKKEAIKRLNEEQNRLSDFTGGTEDRGVLDRALRAAGTGIDVATTVVPVGTSYKGAKIAEQGAKAGVKGTIKVAGKELSKESLEQALKFTAKETALNAGIGAGGAFREGTDTTLSDVANEAAISGVVGGAAAGTGLTAGELLRRRKAGNAVVKELEEAGQNVVGKEAEEAITGTPLNSDQKPPTQWKDSNGDGTPDPIIIDLPSPIAPITDTWTPPGGRATQQSAPVTPRQPEQILQEIEAADNALLTNPQLQRADDGSIVNTATGEVVQESPAKRLAEEIVQSQEVTTQARADQAAAQQAQAAPEAPGTPPQEQTPQTTAPNSSSTAIDTNATMQRLQARREAYNANADQAIMDAQAQTVNRESTYDPIAQADRATIAAQLQQLGLDQASINAIVQDGGTLNRLNVVLQSTDFSRIQNPGGYIRNAIRAMETQSPTVRPAAATQTNEVVQVVNPTTGEKTFYRIPSDQRDTIVNGIDNNRDGTVIAGQNIDGNVTHVTARTPEARGVAAHGFTNGNVYQQPAAAATPQPTPAPVAFDRQQLDTLTGQERVNYIQDTTTKIADNLEANLRQAGSTPDQFFGKLAQVRRGEADASILTPGEVAVNRQMQADLTSAIEYAEEISNTKFGRQGGEYYAPEYRPGRTNTTSGQALLDMLDTGELAGSTYTNTRAIPTAELDVSTTPIKEYLNEMYLYGGRNTPEASQAQIGQALAREAEAEGRVVDASYVNEAALKMRDIADKLKTAAGLSKRERTKTALSNIMNPNKIETNIYKIDVASQLNEVGRLLNKDQVLVNDKARGFTLGNKVDSYTIGDSTLGQQGIRDFYNSDGLGEAIAAAPNASQEFEKALSQYKYLSPEDVQTMKRQALENINRQLEEMSADEVPREVVASAYSYALKNAARTNLSEMAQRVAFNNPTAQKAFNEAVNPILVKDRIQQGYTDAILNGTATWLNNALRGYNPKSAMTELGDFGEINHVAGAANVARVMAEFNVNVPAMVETMNKYGRMAGLDPKAEFARNNMGAIAKIAEAVNNKQPLKVLASIADPMALVKATTIYKESIALKALENIHASRGLQGTDLTRAVLKDYYETVLPSSPLNRSVVNDSALKRVAFQYMNWQLMNVRRGARFATGQSDAGVLAEKGGAKSGARYAATAGSTKLGLWALQNTLFGTTLASAFGIFDPTGQLQGDFTGIEDQNTLDQLMKFGGFSPITSLFQDYYFGIRREEQRAKAVQEGEYTKGDQTNPNFDWGNVNDDFNKQINNFLFPGALQFNRSQKFADDADNGFATNSEGRITYQTPEVGTLDWFRGILGGGSATAPAREYADSPDLLRDPTSIIKDQTIDTLFNTRDYNRPLSATTYAPGYSDTAKQAFIDAETKYGKGSPEARQVLNDWITDGREYNRLYDKFGKDNPEQFKRWTDTYGDDVLTPEKWRTYAGNPEIYNFVKQRRAMEQRDLGRTVDPIFNLPDDQAMAVLQQRSAYTGDDMRLQEFLYQQPWYAGFKAAEAAYYDSFEGDREKNLEGKSQRVKDWNSLSTALYEAKNLPQFNLIAEQQEVTKKYGFGSAESDAWFRQNGDAYKAQKLQYENVRFGIVNQMRALEGVNPLTVEEYMAKIEFPEKDGNGSWTGGKFGSGGGSGGGSYNNDKNKINFVYDNADVTQAPKPKKMTKAGLSINTSAGSRSAGRKVTIGGRSSGRGNGGTI